MSLVRTEASKYSISRRCGHSFGVRLVGRYCTKHEYKEAAELGYRCP